MASTKRPRLGQMADSVLGRPPVTTTAPTSATAPSPEYVKTTMILWPRQMVALDQLALDVRSSTSAAISRTEILRGAIDGIFASGLDLSHCQNEAAVRDALVVAIKGHGR